MLWVLSLSPFTITLMIWSSKLTFNFTACLTQCRGKSSWALILSQQNFQANLPEQLRLSAGHLIHNNPQLNPQLFHPPQPPHGPNQHKLPLHLPTTHFTLRSCFFGFLNVSPSTPFTTSTRKWTERIFRRWREGGEGKKGSQDYGYMTNSVNFSPDQETLSRNSLKENPMEKNIFLLLFINVSQSISYVRIVLCIKNGTTLYPPSPSFRLRYIRVLAK